MTRIIPLIILLAVSAIGCDDDMTSPSTLGDPQVLAMRLEPRTLTPGQSHQAMALGHGLDDERLSWQICALPWIPEEEGLRCAAEDVPELPAPLNAAIPLGDGNPVTLALPGLEVTPCDTDEDCGGYTSCVNGSCPLSVWLRVDDTREEGALTTILQVSTGESLAHPEVSELLDGESTEALPETLEVNAELVVSPTLTDPLGEGGQVVSYFTTAGNFDPWRTRDGEPSTLIAPEEPGEITLTVIVRDPGGGVGWRQHTMTITEAP